MLVRFLSFDYKSPNSDDLSLLNQNKQREVTPQSRFMNITFPGGEVTPFLVL